jgi:hypothetical protein
MLHHSYVTLEKPEQDRQQDNSFWWPNVHENMYIHENVQVLYTISILQATRVNALNKLFRKTYGHLPQREFDADSWGKTHVNLKGGLTRCVE